ncbi:MAG: class I SAM-dependent methyltransferase [Propionibacteriales bacterium]|nr:class I SAM-dependent methyltransferase [Propionibacteriales bacterium]
MTRDQQEVRAFWEARYGEHDQIWTGAANRTLTDVVTELGIDPRTSQHPPRALDLGCGEGADALWLTEAGWQVTGVDVSATALVRAAEAGRSRGVPDAMITWQQLDLATDFPQGSYDLIAASFLASPVHLPRSAVLQRASQAVALGGVLVIVSHAAGPRGSHHHDHQHAETPVQRGHDHLDLPSPAEELAMLALDDEQWTVLLAEVRERSAIGPDGDPTIVGDTVVVVRRRAG